jgi:hypothetical protein
MFYLIDLKIFYDINKKINMVNFLIKFEKWLFNKLKSCVY